MNQKVMNQLEQVTTIDARINALYAKWAKLRGINYNTLNVLYSVYKKPSCTQRQICDEWLIPKQTVSMICKELQEKGFLTLKAVASNKREKNLVFTEAGKKYTDKLMQEMFQMEENVMLKMGEELCVQLVESNRRYCELLEKEVGNE